MTGIQRDREPERSRGRVVIAARDVPVADVEAQIRVLRRLRERFAVMRERFVGTAEFHEHDARVHARIDR